MFPRLPARATFVANTNFVSGTQKCFWLLFRNMLCPQQMFPSLRSPRNIMSNNVSATMCPRLPVPLRCWQTRTHCCGHIVVHDVSWAAQTGKHLLGHKMFLNKIRNIVSRTQNLCPQQVLRARANGKHLCRQQCVRNNVSSFARAFINNSLALYLARTKTCIFFQ